MAETKIYPKGLRFFPKHEKAPSFVKGTLLITPNELIAWLKENEGLLTDYKGAKQLKLQVLENDKGLYAVVDTYKSGQASGQAEPAHVPDKEESPF